MRRMRDTKHSHRHKTQSQIQNTVTDKKLMYRRKTQAQTQNAGTDIGTDTVSFTKPLACRNK